MKLSGTELTTTLLALDCTKLEALYSRLPVMLHTADANGRLTTVSDFWVSNLGYTRSEALGRLAIDFLSEPSRRHAENVCLPQFLDNGTVCNEQLQFIRKDGKPVDVLLSAIADVDADGDIVRSVAVSIDITDRLEAERALTESEARIQTIYEAANDAILILNQHRDRIYDGNPKAQQLLGYTSEELAGMPMQLVHPDEMGLIDQIWEQLKTTRVARTGKLSCRTKDGRRVPADISFSVITLDNREFVLAVVRDMSEMHAAKQQMDCYQQKLRSLTRELSAAEEHERRRIATDLHDTVAQSLLIASLKLSEICMSHGAITLSTELDELQEVLNQAVTETRTVLYEISPPILHDLGIEAALKWKLEQFSKQHGIRAVFDDDHAEKPLSDGLQIFLYKAAQELLKNIVKHADATRIGVSIGVVGDYVRLAISDNGRGFTRSDSTPCDDLLSGFGLFNIRDRLDYYGGRSEVKSKPMQGSTIELFAPLATIDV